jgi:hypothetical protein
VKVIVAGQGTTIEQLAKDSPIKQYATERPAVVERPLPGQGAHGGPEDQDRALAGRLINPRCRANLTRPPRVSGALFCRGLQER